MKIYYHQFISIVMQKNNEWNQKSLYLTEKKVHLENLLGIYKHDQNTFLTSSEDKTMRLWDIRVKSSVKLIKNQKLTSQLSNPSSDNNLLAFIASEKQIFSFDLRKEQIFIEKITSASQNQHLDSISRISYSHNYNQILACDDEGDIRVYSPTKLSCLKQLQQEHTNICNDAAFIYSEHKDYKQRKIVVSGGFDATLIIWDVQQEKPIKKIAVDEILKKYSIKVENQNYSFIHRLYCYQSSIILALESGHVMCLPVYEPRKPKFIMQASLTRLTGCYITQLQNIKNKNFLITTDAIDTFSLFDFQQRINNQPKFLVKYKATAEPIDLITIKNNIILATASPTLSIYAMKC